MNPTPDMTADERLAQQQRRDALTRLWRATALVMSGTAAGAMVACGEEPEKGERPVNNS